MAKSRKTVFAFALLGAMLLPLGVEGQVEEALVRIDGMV